MGNSQSNSVDGEIDISHFKLLQVIGKGGFGMVRIVQKRDTKKKYALKYIKKRNCIKRNAVQHIFRERIILEELNHPFIVNLQFAFQDDEHMFMVLDLATGGDVRFHLKTVGILPEQTVRIYAAEIVSALAYLHSKNVVHRDLKPENLLVDENGHVHVTDFNVAVLLSEKIPNSRSGTAAYLAPEMLNGESYTFSVDWWALGVTLYECTYNKAPFNAGGGLTLNNAIRRGRFKLLSERDMHPNNRYQLTQSPNRDDFLKRLLTVPVKDRLGCGPTDAQELFQHPWLADIDLKRLHRFGYKPDHVPSQTQSNYDLTPALEELLYDASPLGSKPVRKKKDEASSSSKSIWKSTFGIANGQRIEKDAQKLHMQKQLELIENSFKPYIKETGHGTMDRVELLRISRVFDRDYKLPKKEGEEESSKSGEKNQSQPAVSHMNDPEHTFAVQSAKSEQKENTEYQATNIQDRLQERKKTRNQDVDNRFDTLLQDLPTSSPRKVNYEDLHMEALLMDLQSPLQEISSPVPNRQDSLDYSTLTFKNNVKYFPSQVRKPK